MILYQKTHDTWVRILKLLLPQTSKLKYSSILLDFVRRLCYFVMCYRTWLYKSRESSLTDNLFLGGNIIYVAHAASLDIMVSSLRNLNALRSQNIRATYSANQQVRVPYCSLGAMMDKPFKVVPPPCPPCVNTSSGRFDWKVLLHVDDWYRLFFINWHIGISIIKTNICSKKEKLSKLFTSLFRTYILDLHWFIVCSKVLFVLI